MQRGWWTREADGNWGTVAAQTASQELLMTIALVRATECLSNPWDCIAIDINRLHSPKVRLDNDACHFVFDESREGPRLSIFHWSRPTWSVIASDRWHWQGHHISTCTSKTLQQTIQAYSTFKIVILYYRIYGYFMLFLFSCCFAPWRWPPLAQGRTLPKHNSWFRKSGHVALQSSRLSSPAAQDPAPAPPAPSGYVHYCGPSCTCQISAVVPVNLQTCETNCEGAAGFMHYL